MCIARKVTRDPQCVQKKMLKMCDLPEVKLSYRPRQTIVKIKLCSFFFYKKKRLNLARFLNLTILNYFVFLYY